MLCLFLLPAVFLFWASSERVHVSALSCYHCSDFAEEAVPNDYGEYGESLDVPPSCDVMFLMTCAEHEDSCILGLEHHFAENGTTFRQERRQCSSYTSCKMAQSLYHNRTNLAYFQQALGRNFTMQIHCCQDDGCNEVAGVAMATTDSKALLLISVLAVLMT